MFVWRLAAISMTQAAVGFGVDYVVGPESRLYEHSEDQDVLNSARSITNAKLWRGRMALPDRLIAIARIQGKCSRRRKSAHSPHPAPHPAQHKSACENAVLFGFAQGGFKAGAGTITVFITIRQPARRKVRRRCAHHSNRHRRSNRLQRRR